MAIPQSGGAGATAARRPVVNLPQPVWLILLTLAIGLAGGLSYADLVRGFGAGYGRALGDFTLILLPSFVLAACLSLQPLGGASGLAAAIAPVTAAGMVCPDTGYATLSSIADRRKLSVAFGSFAGFRLLFPAGPLIIATGLGVDERSLPMFGAALMLPVWLAGELWARRRAGPPARDGDLAADRRHALLSWRGVRTLAPLIVLGRLLVAGGVGGLPVHPLLDFVSRPKGALVVAAALALIGTHPDARRTCLDTAMRRTGALLIVIGAAGAFGAMVSRFVPLDRIAPTSTSVVGILVMLFAITMVVKLIYGSAMATFATAAALLAPIIQMTGAPGVPAVLAICLGSFAILPTDSFYWLVRSDALPEHTERTAIVTLAGGAALQAVTGLVALLVLYALQLV